MRSTTSDNANRPAVRARMLVAAIALLATGAAGTAAHAAEMTVPPPAPAAYNWTSVYIGVIPQRCARRCLLQAGRCAPRHHRHTLDRRGEWSATY
jgi:hypothetical protein